jgi:hypothetical protein
LDDSWSKSDKGGEVEGGIRAEAGGDEYDLDDSDAVSEVEDFDDTQHGGNIHMSVQHFTKDDVAKLNPSSFSPLHACNRFHNHPQSR